VSILEEGSASIRRDVERTFHSSSIQGEERVFRITISREETKERGENRKVLAEEEALFGGKNLGGGGERYERRPTAHVEIPMREPLFFLNQKQKKMSPGLRMTALSQRR